MKKLNKLNKLFSNMRLKNILFTINFIEKIKQIQNSIPTFILIESCKFG